MFDHFEIPVVLFLFKRVDSVLKILDVIESVKPQKLYLLSDGGRNQEEKKIVQDCRTKVDEKISHWDFKVEVIRRYFDDNQGVYINIGEGAKWVFSLEEKAIFIEDDNLPIQSFFYYCQKMLERYENNDRVIWVCGTNYLSHYESKYSYMFTQALLPCGWASWSENFLKYYDGNLDTIHSKEDIELIKSKYKNKELFFQQGAAIYREYKKKLQGIKFNSWDFQMVYTIKKYDLLGISPKHNQIKNIGVDQFSIHGGYDETDVMIKRFCGVETESLGDIIDPPEVEIDPVFERKMEHIILYPLKNRIISYVLFCIKKMLGIYHFDSIKEELRKRKDDKAK